MTGHLRQPKTFTDALRAMNDAVYTACRMAPHTCPDAYSLRQMAMESDAMFERQAAKDQAQWSI